MKKITRYGWKLVLVLFIFCCMGNRAQAAQPLIHAGVYIEDMDVSGMTKEEARQTVENYLEELGNKEIKMETAGGNSITATAAELGLSWANPDMIEEAAGLGTEGNIVQRYKAIRDLEYTNHVFPLEITFDKALLTTVIEEGSAPYNIACQEASLSRENGVFRVQEGVRGEETKVSESVEKVYQYLTQEWGRQDAQVELVIGVVEPKASKEDLMEVKDVLGTFTTSYKTSGSSRSANVANGANLINKTTLFPGETFSTYEAVSPFSEANGYYMAGSYLNGMVVDSLGGGICQVSTTLYNAVLLSELEVTQRHNHSMIVSYVDPSADAAIAESSGKDFTFVNNTGHPIYIEGYTEDKKITFTIYGVETRSPDREVIYESEVLETIRPDSEKIIAVEKPIGYIDVQSAHIGYKARLWKIVKENGVEISREQVNSSSYKMTPRTATVGVASADPEARAAVLAAIQTGSIDHTRAVANAIVANANASAAQPPEIPAQQPEQPQEPIEDAVTQ